MRKLTAVLIIALSSTALSAQAGGIEFPEALPPVANPGECYAQVEVPAQYATGTQSVIRKEAHTRLKVVDAELVSRQETVLTKEASIRYEVRQPRYNTVTEKTLTRPAYNRFTVSEPQFSTVTESLQTSAPHLVWKRGNPAELQRQGYRIHSTADGRLRSSSGYQGGSYATTQQGGDTCGPGCEIWCLVEEPAKSVTTTRRVMSAPARITRIPVEAQYRTITKQVVADPGGVSEIPIPAEYSTVTVQDVVRPADVYHEQVPAEYGEVQTQTLISPERYEWRRVLCQPGTGPVASGYNTTSSYNSASTYSSSSHGESSLAGAAPQPNPTTYGTSTSYYGTENRPSYKRRSRHRVRGN